MQEAVKLRGGDRRSCGKRTANYRSQLNLQYTSTIPANLIIPLDELLTWIESLHITLFSLSSSLALCTVAVNTIIIPTNTGEVQLEYAHCSCCLF